MENLNYSLSEIANWTSKNSEVTIPALQRGLVWKPNQVELLWDSILRGFPIGSFLLSDIIDEKGNGKYYLMDGQQRFNAISLGYNKVENARAVLWIDLNPPQVKNSTRSYWIKATTFPHPWGFKNDDDCSRLNTAEKREALDAFGLKGSIYNNEFSLNTTWPIEANTPIPLYCLLKAGTDNCEMFIEDSLKCLKDSLFTCKNQIEHRITEREKEYLKELYPVFRGLKDYRINCNHLPKNVMESEIMLDSAEQTTLEVLFTRLNTGGTTISKDDLNYSAIKAYWPSIKNTNDQLAQQYMNPSKLVMLAFRLALTQKDDKNLKTELSIKNIRSTANNASERAAIEDLYNEKLEAVLCKVDEWLGVNDKSDLKTPSLLRTLIARHSPDIYLLLMYFAYKEIQEGIDLKPKEIKALAFCLHWFAKDKKGCVQEIFTRCKDGVNLTNVRKGVSRLMHDYKLLHIYNPTDVAIFINRIDESPNWRIWNSIPAPAHEFFDLIFWNHKAEPREMLLYAEREYINSHFSNYDPARQDMWAEYNRPWDFDHIIARNRIVGKHGEFRGYDKVWLDSIGNFAAISYESNRSKNDGDDYSEYNENIDALAYDNGVESFPYEITYNAHASQDFAKITYHRFCVLYDRVYEIIKPLVEQTILSDTLQRRKDLFNKIVELFPGAITHFAASDGNDHLLSREQDWARDWVGVGVIKGDFMVCLEWQATFDQEPTNLEFGIRKALGTNVTKENMSVLKKEITEDSLNPWWYTCEYLNKLDIDFIKEKFETVLKQLNNP